MAVDTTTIGGYKIGRMLGQGAMGTVYLGLAPGASLVAVKLLHLHLTALEEFVKRFRREAELAAKLAHPNVVKVLGHGEDDGQHYIAMEYVEGRTLNEYLADAGIAPVSAKTSRSAKASAAAKNVEAAPTLGTSPSGPPVKNLPIAETIRILRQVAGVLQAAADLGLVHRDLKPQNILIDPKGNAKVLDFGLAKDTEALTSMLSMTGQSIGTPPYMSPEQCEGVREVDVRSDLYSLGATAYQMLTGRAPFAGPTASAYYRQHLDEVPIAPAKLNPAVPENLSQVVERLLAKKVEDRHQTPAELIEDLNRCERGDVPLKRYKPRKQRQHGARHTVLAVAATLVLAGAAFAGWSYYRAAHADTAIRERVSQAEFAAERGELSDALAQLDAVIADFAGAKREQLAPAIAQRNALRTRLAEQERQQREAEAERLAKQARLEADGDAKLQAGDHAGALADYLQARALGETEALRDKIGTAERWKQEQEAKAAEAVLLAREEAERQRRAEADEHRRRLDYEQALDAANRLYDDGNEDNLEEASALAAKARQLARGEAEIAAAVNAQDRIAAALAKRRPVVAVVDFSIDKGVEVRITGSAVAVKTEQALGAGYRLVTRTQVAKALQELQFQTSDLVDQAKAQRFGQMVGAEYLVTGSVIQIGTQITIAAQIVRVETGTIRQTAEVSTDRLDAINDQFVELVKILSMTDEAKQTYIAEQRDAPQLTIRAFLNGSEVTGAPIEIDGIVLPQAAPATCRLELGKSYAIKVTMPPRYGITHYDPYVTTYRVERKGLQELRATLELVRIRVPRGFRAVRNQTESFTNTLWAREIVHEATGIEMVYIPSRSFAMGSPTTESDRDNDETPHRVTLTKGFYLGKYEVTQAQWQKVMGANPSNFKNAGVNAPVETVSWDDCQAFCRKLGEGFRLPTEAEWEFACRTGQPDAFHNGKSLGATMANFDGNYPYGQAQKGEFRRTTIAVGSFHSNGWGLHDMHGNVAEWCHDWYGEYPAAAVTDPTGPDSGSFRVRRGGSWSDHAKYCRSADRHRDAPGYRNDRLGFRLALTVPGL